MNYITTTQLRTLSTDLVSALANGQSVDLIHRSNVIGQISPKKVNKPKLFNAKKFDQLAKSLNFKPIKYNQVKKNYYKHLVEEYGKNIS